jgi:2-polyprenyl-3-methyl-5-hydroxy-6-metoxy-1,4-benzoquinol methylase
MGERPDFSERAELTEFMDGPCSFEELRACLRDLETVNRLTRAHRPTLVWLERVMGSMQSANPPPENSHAGRPLRLVDVGCGYGDMLRTIERWAARRGLAAELIGVDVNANAIRAAREATPPKERITWVVGDVCRCAEAQNADLITVSSVTHHMSEEEIVRLLAWMERSARVGWIVTDLQRKPVPYRVFGALMRGPWWHRFIRPDGLASIRRSFVAEDWMRMCAAAGVDAGAVEIREHRPARLWVGRVKR